MRLRLLLKCFRTRDKNILTRAYIRPILEYCCSPIWSPHSKQLVLKIERAQKYFTGAIPGFRALSYHSRLQLLGLKTLEHRHLVNDLCLCYKIVNGLIQCRIPEFPSFLASRTRGHPLRLRQEKCSTKHRQQYFIDRDIKPWNFLPLDIINSTTLPRFKSCLSLIDLNNYLLIK